MKKTEVDREIIRIKIKEIKQLRGHIFDELSQSRVMTDIIYTDLNAEDLTTLASSHNMIQIIED